MPEGRPRGRHLGVGNGGARAVEDGRLVAQPGHEPLLAGPGRPDLTRHQQGGVVALAQLSQRDDDGRQAEDNVQEAHDDQDGVDQHRGLARLTEAVSLSLLPAAVGSVGVPGEARGRVDDHCDGGD